MNSVLTESLYFFRSNFKLITLFILPFALFSIVYEVIGIADPKSSTRDFLNFTYLIFIYPVHIGFILILIDKLSNNEKISFLQIILKVITFWVPLFLVALLASIIIGGGLVLFIIPGVWLFLRLMLAPLYVLFEGLSATQAIGAAFNESKPYQSIFLFALLPFIIISIASIATAFNAPLSSNYFLATLQAVIGEYLFILISIVQYRLYTKIIKNT